jgi:hypothetical protein
MDQTMSTDLQIQSCFLQTTAASRWITHVHLRKLTAELDNYLSQTSTFRRIPQELVEEV